MNAPIDPSVLAKLPLAVLDALPFLVFVKDEQGHFTYANSTFCRFLGRPLNDILGKTEFDFYTPALAEAYRRGDQLAIQSGHYEDSAEEMQFATGSKLRVHVIKQRVSDQTGQRDSILTIIWDVTEMVHLREIVSAATRELEDKKSQLRRVEQQLQTLEAIDRQTASRSRPPKVFVSYKHSDRAHAAWVRQFTSDLMEFHAIDCFLDQFDLDYGDSIQSFMQQIKTKATHVLLIITPETVSSIESNAGGVAFEAQLASALRDRGMIKLIPVLRSGEQTPAYVASHLYVDFRGEAIYYDALKRLADSIKRNRNPT